MAKPMTWRYVQLMCAGEHAKDLTPIERKMFEAFCDLFWQDNVRVDSQMTPPRTRKVWSGTALPMCKMLPPVKQTGYLDFSRANL